MPLKLATFNVKDLLDRADFPAEPSHLPDKLAWTAAAIARLDPDVLALQEVGSEAILDDLLACMDRRGGYVAKVVGTRDQRGIRCALLSRRPVLAAHVHTAPSLAFPAFREGDPAPFGARIPLRRGVVEARIDAGEALGTIDVFVAHFKSRRSVALRTAEGVEIPAVTPHARAEAMLRSLVMRAAEALFVRSLVDARLEDDPDAKVAVCGDLNDVPESVTLSVVRGDGTAHPLACAARLVPEERRFSVLHEGERAQIDHVLVSRALWPHVRAARFFNEELREHAPSGRAGEPEPATVDSDHAPLVVDLA